MFFKKLKLKKYMRFAYHSCVSITLLIWYVCEKRRVEKAVFLTASAIVQNSGFSCEWDGVLALPAAHSLGCIALPRGRPDQGLADGQGADSHHNYWHCRYVAPLFRKAFQQWKGKSAS